MKTTLIRFGCSLILVMGMISFSVSAHEPRDGVAGGVYNISVGNQVEPAIAREPNGFDLIIRNNDDTPATVQTIELEVEILFLSEDKADAKIKRHTQLSGELRRDRNSANRFSIQYMPTRAGAYGYHITGTIDGNTINELFICGGGTQNLAGRAFGCVSEIQRFPHRGH